MSAVVWQDPPRYKHEGLREQLRANPGRWALVGEYDSASFMTAIKKWPGGFESRSHRRDGKFEIYARFVGES